MAIRIPPGELEFTFVRSSGPGGQNVNKVNSKAVLRWDALSSPSLPADSRLRILNKLAPQLTQEGELVLTSDQYRDQIRNRQDCIDKLEALLESAAQRPKIRRKTKPSFSSKRRAKEAKGRQSEKKSLRRRPHDD